MGEARQRRLAREAGKPWDCDKPKPSEPRRYLGDDGEWHVDEPPQRKPRPTFGLLMALAAVGVPSPGERK